MSKEERCLPVVGSRSSPAAKASQRLPPAPALARSFARSLQAAVRGSGDDQVVGPTAARARSSPNPGPGSPASEAHLCLSNAAAHAASRGWPISRGKPVVSAAASPAAPLTRKRKAAAAASRCRSSSGRCSGRRAKLGRSPALLGLSLLRAKTSCPTPEHHMAGAAARQWCAATCRPRRPASACALPAWPVRRSIPRPSRQALPLTEVR
jgi:hypothetical protein